MTNSKKKTAFDKRVKRRVTGREHEFFAACPPGLKQLCYSEMLDTGFSKNQLDLIPGGIEFKARPDQAMTAALYLKSPLRILMRLARFKASAFDQLEKKAAAVDWPVFLPQNSALKFNVTTHKSRLYHSDAIAQRLEKVISSQLSSRDGYGSGGKGSTGEHTLFVRTDNDHFALSVDITGGLLFKRGVKTKTTQAPLRENIAAAMLAWAGLSRDDILVDPMCGSGTFSLEAAMLKANVPPGFYRSFAFEQLPGFSRKTFNHLKKKAEQAFIHDNKTSIFASDMDDKALAALKQNAHAHGFSRSIDIRKKDFFSLHPFKLGPNQKKGIVVLNPPYGKRIAQGADQADFYKEMSKKLCTDFKGWRLAIILPSKKDMARLNLKLALKPVFHGGMDAFAGIGTL